METKQTEQMNVITSQTFNLYKTHVQVRLRDQIRGNSIHAESGHVNLGEVYLTRQAEEHFMY